MLEEQQTQFRQEGEPAFVEDTENENSADSSSENTTDNQTPPPGEDNQQGANNENGNGDGTQQKKDDNFADHPRWKEREEQWTKRFNEQERRHVEELGKLRSEIESKIQGVGQKIENAQPVQMPSWFGGTEEQWKEFQSWNKQLMSEAKAEAIKELETKSTAEQKRIDEATTYFNEQVGIIESDKELNPSGEKIDRNKLLKTALDFDLVDSKGRWNYKAAFKIMKNQKTSNANNSTQEKRNLANASIADKKSDTKPAPFMTSEDFQKPGNRPW